MWVRLGDVVFETEKVTHAAKSTIGPPAVAVYFDGGNSCVFEGEEAQKAWAFFEYLSKSEKSERRNE